MQFDLESGPGCPLCIARLGIGQSVEAVRGAMVARDAHIGMAADDAGGRGVEGRLDNLERKMLMGGSFSRNTFTAETAPGEVAFAPALPGEIMIRQVEGRELIVRQSAYLCSASSVEIEAWWGGFEAYFGGDRLFWLRASGHGPLALNAFGAVKEIDVDGSFIVDTGHVVAFDPTLTFAVRRAGSWYSTILAVESLVCRFEGEGKLFIQSRNPARFGSELGSRLPPRGGG